MGGPNCAPLLLFPRSPIPPFSYSPVLPFTRSLSPSSPASQLVISPASADAATVYGLARYTCPGPERPGKSRLIALMVTVPGSELAPGPALMQAPHEGPSTSAPTARKIST